MRTIPSHVMKDKTASGREILHYSPILLASFRLIYLSLMMVDCIALTKNEPTQPKDYQFLS